MEALNEMKNTSYEVYINLHEMIKYRNGTVKNPLSVTEFTQIMNLNDYIEITGVVNNKKLVILLLTEESKYDKKQALVVLINNINNRKETLDLIIIYKKPEKVTKRIAKIKEIEVDKGIISDKKRIAIEKSIIEFYKKNTNHKISIKSHEYSAFLFKVPDYTVPHYLLKNSNEIKEFLNLQGGTERDFPIILHTDPMVIWLGAQSGDVVKIERYSESAGIAIYYRYVE